MKTTCKHMRTQLALYGTGELDRHEKAEVDLHLHSCESCRAELARLGQVPELVRAGAEAWWADVRQGVRESLTAAERGAGRRSVRGGIKEMRFVWKPLLIGLLVIGIIAGSTTFAITLTRDRAENQPGGGVLPVEQWPTFQQNMQRTGRSPYVGPETPEVKWRWPGDFGHRIGVTNLVVGNDGVMYIGMTDLTALNLAGDPGRDPRSREVWQIEPRELNPPLPDGVFLTTYPTVAADGTIYVGGSYSRTQKGVLLAVNLDGAEKWRFVLDEDSSFIYVSPAVANDGTVYVASENGSLYALTDDGELKWSYSTGGPIYVTAPALDQHGTVYVGSADNKVYAIASSGEEKWRFEAGEHVWGVSIGEDGTVYATARNGTLYALSPEGQELWRNTLDGDGVSVKSVAGPLIGPDGTIYVASGDERLHAVASDGGLKWTFSTSPAVEDGSVYVTVDAAGTVFMGSMRDRNLYAISPDGAEKWRIRFGDAVVGYPTISAEGVIYVTTGHREFSQVYAIGEKGSVV